MYDAIGAVPVTENKSMTERQLSAYGIGSQFDPWTSASFHVCIVSNLGAETADRNHLIHGILPRLWTRLSMNAPPVGPLLAASCEPADETTSTVWHISGPSPEFDFEQSPGR